MSCYLCSNETISIVADVISTNFDIGVEEAFDDLLAYNLENLKERYDDEDWGQENSHYVEVDCSEAQKIQSIRNYLYQTTDYIKNDLTDWLEEYSTDNYNLIDNASEKLYWDIADKQYDEEPVKETKTKKQLFFERNLDIKDIAKLVRKDLKKEFGKDCKFSVRIHRYSGGQSLTVSCKQATDDIIYSYEELCEKADFERLQYDNPQLYEHLDERYKKEQYLTDETLARINEIVDYYNYDDSDIYYDYYEVGFGTSIRQKVDSA